MYSLGDLREVEFGNFLLLSLEEKQQKGPREESFTVRI